MKEEIKYSKAEKLDKAIGGIDKDLIEAADREASSKHGASVFFKWGSAAAALIMVAVITAFIVPHIKNESAPEIYSSTETRGTYAQATKKASDDEALKGVDTIAEESSNDGFVQWNDKTVSLKLFDELESADGNDVLTVIACPTVDGGFVYKGKTISEYEKEINEKKLLIEKLYQLIKEEDITVYVNADMAESVDETVDPSRRYCEERKEFYGEELLSRYIVDGRFLKEKAENDLASALQDNGAEDGYNEALKAYRYESCREIKLTKDEFASYSDDGVVDCIFYSSIE